MLKQMPNAANTYKNMYKYKPQIKQQENNQIRH